MPKRKPRTKQRTAAPSLADLKKRDLLRSIRADLRRRLAGPQVSEKPKRTD